ncbi:helix-turn-helix transcriptional regulator [Nitratireductor sp. XY-223]|uniref:helix-turn-helix transcriptional regulator n=1 Tax=Nitratireductor sp. XY-223 TaxID=2561926 RepID=UPI0019822E97|nr:helix-turn-helix transcriptional regulator [Nitratireductor sp. XY-223]
MVSNNMPGGTYLWLLLLLQAVCAVFLLAEVSGDLIGWETEETEDLTHIAEFAVIVALILSLAYTAANIRKVLTRQGRLLDQLRAASGEFMGLVDQYFNEWGLTPSERDVALLSLKGLQISDIAELRNTSTGTVKAQCNAIYRKAGVNGRPQLLSIFIEDLLAADLKEPQGAILH